MRPTRRFLLVPWWWWPSVEGGLLVPHYCGITVAFRLLASVALAPYLTTYPDNVEMFFFALPPFYRNLWHINGMSTRNWSVRLFFNILLYSSLSFYLALKLNSYGEILFSFMYFFPIEISLISSRLITKFNNTLEYNHSRNKCYMA